MGFEPVKPVIIFLVISGARTYAATLQSVPASEVGPDEHDQSMQRVTQPGFASDNGECLGMNILCLH